MKNKFCGMLAVTLLTSAVYAETFNVTRMDDPVPDGCQVNNCSLREAVISADQTPAKDTIVLPAGIYLIDLDGNDSGENTGDLDINSDMDFIGAPSTIDGQSLGRMLDIRSDANVSLQNITLRNANTSLDTNGALNGGALQINGGSLTLDNVTFSDNRTQTLGGGIYAFGGAVINIIDSNFENNIAARGAAINASTGISVRNTVFRGNRADLIALGSGAAAYLTGSTSDSLFEDVIFDQNLATGSGGAVYFTGRSLTIEGVIATGNRSTSRSGGMLTVPGTSHAKQVVIISTMFDGNSAIDDGGAIFFSGDQDTLNIQHSSFVGNLASDNGGALYLTGGDVTVTNDTFSGNEATDDGGAIYVFGAVLTLHHLTFSAGAANRGSALAVNGSANINSVELANNLIDGNCFISDTDSVSSLGGNVEGTGDSCDLDSADDLVSQSDVQLGLQPLKDTAGNAPTHKLSAASVARGQGVAAICLSVEIDQLFENRGSPCNSGADESDTVFRDSFESNQDSG